MADAPTWMYADPNALEEWARMVDADRERRAKNGGFDSFVETLTRLRQPGQIAGGAANYLRAQQGSGLEDRLRQASLLPVPVASDLAGLGADAMMYARDPESRTVGNAALSGLGLLPIIPAMTVMRGQKLGFDAWRKSIWDDVAEGRFHPEEKVPETREILKGAPVTRLFRAMSDGEWDAAQKSGVFRPIREGDADLYVTADPDRLAGGAYGAKGGGRIVEFDAVPVKKATGRLWDVEEISADEIPVAKVRRVWKWDSKAQDHVLEWERNAGKVSPKPDHDLVRLWRTQRPGRKTIGRWFSLDKDVAEEMASLRGWSGPAVMDERGLVTNKNVELFYVDVPRNEVDKYMEAATRDAPKAEAAAYLPREIASTAKKWERK